MIIALVSMTAVSFLMVTLLWMRLIALNEKVGRVLRALDDRVSCIEIDREISSESNLAHRLEQSLHRYPLPVHES